MTGFLAVDLGTALVTREFLKVAHIDHRQVHARLSHGFQLFPNGLD